MGQVVEGWAQVLGLHSLIVGMWNKSSWRVFSNKELIFAGLFLRNVGHLTVITEINQNSQTQQPTYINFKI